MRCYVYKSRRRAETYLFLAQKDDFSRVPESLRAPLGELDLTLEFDLTPGRKLARGDADVMRAHLAELGFHIQFPPPALPPIPMPGTHDAD